MVPGTGHEIGVHVLDQGLIRLIETILEVLNIYLFD
jgi:hypothetical protein